MGPHLCRHREHTRANALVLTGKSAPDANPHTLWRNGFMCTGGVAGHQTLRSTGSLASTLHMNLPRSNPPIPWCAITHLFSIAVVSTQQPEALGVHDVARAAVDPAERRVDEREGVPADTCDFSKEKRRQRWGVHVVISRHGDVMSSLRDHSTPMLPRRPALEDRSGMDATASHIRGSSVDGTYVHVARVSPVPRVVGDDRVDEDGLGPGL